jgi:hypothetical protein
LQAHNPKRAKRDRSQIKRKMCVERYILGISLTHKAKLKKILAGYPVKTSVKGGRHQPIKLSNKGRKHLTSSSLGIKPLY